MRHGLNVPAAMSVAAVFFLNRQGNKRSGILLLSNLCSRLKPEPCPMSISSFPPKSSRVTPQSNGFQVAVEFILNKDLREEILKVVKIIQSQNLEVERPTIREKLFRRVKLE